MNKTRLEAFSDGVFAIAMTILVFDVKLPDVAGIMTNAQLWYTLGALWPLITSFALSFLVLAVFWINHNFLFHSFTKGIDRYLNLMNMVYLMFIAFVPFAAHLFGTYPRLQPAALVYGVTILAIVFLMRVMVIHVRKRPELSREVSPRVLRQATIRANVTIISYILGIIASFVFIPVSVFFYLFPLIFNIIPGTLNLIENLFGLDFGPAEESA